MHFPPTMIPSVNKYINFFSIILHKILHHYTQQKNTFWSPTTYELQKNEWILCQVHNKLLRWKRLGQSVSMPKHVVQEQEKLCSRQIVTTLSWNTFSRSNMPSIFRNRKKINRRVAKIEKTTLECIQVPCLEFPSGQIDPTALKIANVWRRFYKLLLRWNYIRWCCY